MEDDSTAAAHAMSGLAGGSAVSVILKQVSLSTLKEEFDDLGVLPRELQAGAKSTRLHS